jgi:hypothetical protein
MPPPFARMISGFYVSRAVDVMARLGIADILSNGPVHGDELAQRTKIHASSLKRVLRLLVNAGVVTEDEGGRFGLTAIGDCLRTSVPGSMRAVLTVSRPASRPSAYLAEHPEDAANFKAAMSTLLHRSPR